VFISLCSCLGKAHYRSCPFIFVCPVPRLLTRKQPKRRNVNISANVFQGRSNHSPIFSLKGQRLRLCMSKRTAAAYYVRRWANILFLVNETCKPIKKTYYRFITATTTSLNFSVIANSFCGKEAYL